MVDRLALLSDGGRDPFSKTPAALNPVICFRVELHLESEPGRHRCADSYTAKGLSSSNGPLFVMGLLEERKWKK